MANSVTVQLKHGCLAQSMVSLAKGPLQIISAAMTGATRLQPARQGNKIGWIKVFICNLSQASGLDTMNLVLGARQNIWACKPEMDFHFPSCIQALTKYSLNKPRQQTD